MEDEEKKEILAAVLEIKEKQAENLLTWYEEAFDKLFSNYLEKGQQHGQFTASQLDLVHIDDAAKRIANMKLQASETLSRSVAQWAHEKAADERAALFMSKEVLEDLNSLHFPASV